MNGQAIVTMTQTSCCKCGVVFWVPAAFDLERREEHDTFYCPTGHPLVYYGKSEAEKLRDQLATSQRCCDSQKARAASLEEAVEHRERQVRAYRGVMTRIKRKSELR